MLNKYQGKTSLAMIEWYKTPPFWGTSIQKWKTKNRNFRKVIFFSEIFWIRIKCPDYE